MERVINSFCGAVVWFTVEIGKQGRVPGNDESLTFEVKEIAYFVFLSRNVYHYVLKNSLQK